MSRWRKVSTPHFPSAAGGGYGNLGLNGMTRDPIRDSSIITSFTSQPWSYDLVSGFADWVTLGSPFTGNTGKNRSSCWDAANNRVVAFGGYDGTSNNETWTYNGFSWTKETPVTSPIARLGCLMEYCPALGAVVMTGGSKSGGFGLVDAITDTWMWDGTDWTQLFPAHQPTARVATHLCILGNNVYFFGGMDLTNRAISGATWLNDTWKFDGTDWTQLFPATSPPVAEWSKCASWPDRSIIIHAINPSSTLWMFDGTNWTSETPSCGPYNDGEPHSHNDWDALGYLPRLGKVLGMLVNGETWELINNVGSTGTTNAATSTICSTAKLNASVTVLAEETADVYFQYGPTTSYGSSVFVGTLNPGTTAVSANLTGLTPGSTYHYRVVVYCNGTCPVNNGADVSFTQSACTASPTLNAHFDLGSDS